MASRKTTLVRFPKDIKNVLDAKFPEVSFPSLMRVMYNTSAIRAEAFLRNDKTKKR